MPYTLSFCCCLLLFVVVCCLLLFVVVVRGDSFGERESEGNVLTSQSLMPTPLLAGEWSGDNNTHCPTFKGVTKMTQWSTHN